MGMLQLIYIFLFWVFFGLLVSHFATQRGRHPIGWFIVGLTMGIFGLAMLFLLPKVRQKRPYQSPSKGSPSVRRSDAWLKMWYYLDPSHKQQGPFEFPDFIKTWKERRICESTYIWGEGMQEWKQLNEHPELLKELNQ